MTSNGDRFEGAYNKIDALLRTKAGEARPYTDVPSHPYAPPR
jgi:hypothetical protein